MINVANFERRSRFLVKAIANKVKYDNAESPKYAYWALYLDDNRKKPREVDTCATSYCISILEAEKQRMIANGSVDKYVYHDIIQQAIRTLIKLRGKNGAWPSVVEPRILQNSVSEYAGEVAIGDNYYALTALMDVGFLSKQFEYTNAISEDMQTTDGRIRYIFQTVDWLLEHRAISDDGGWYYTNTTNSISEPVTIPTANVLVILNRIKNSIIGLERYQSHYKKVVDAIQHTNEFLAINIKADGGIGKYITSDIPHSSLLHTCRMIDALILSKNPEYMDELERAIDFVIKTCDQYPDCDFQKVPVDFYSEQYNLVLPSDDEIIIRHENFTEGMLLFTLLHILHQNNQSGSYISKTMINPCEITNIVNKLIKQLENMQTKEGVCNGLFKCHVARAEGMHPVYASFEGYQAFRMYMSLDKHILTTNDKVRLQKEIIKDSPFDPHVPYLFVSYSHQNDNVVLYDVQRLKKQFNCWIDFENLDGGRCSSENDWTEKVQPVLDNPNCKGVIIYISKGSFQSNGLLREAEWIARKKIQFYTFLIDFSETITSREMAVIIDSISDNDTQRKLRRKNTFTYLCQATSDITEFSYYHRYNNFSHLSHPDFHNWLRKIELA